MFYADCRKLLQLILMEQQYPLHMDISAHQYAKLKTKQLGNYHIHAQKSQSRKWNDPRLNYLDPNLFINRVILDIGCNEGIIAIPIAIKFKPQHIKAIDIDQSLIKKLERNINKFIEKNKPESQLPQQLITDISELPLYFQEQLQTKMQKNPKQIITIFPKIELKQEAQSPQFPDNISFELLNVLFPNKVQFYDTILCMNVTKWIHLTFGDNGIRRLFGNISSMLHQGGILVLDAQPWRSYNKKKKLYPIYRQNYDKILCKPEKFKEMLRSFGLFHKQTIQNTDLKHPIHIFQKKGFYSSDLSL